MLRFQPDTKIYICTGYTDMRKGANSLSMLADTILEKQVCSGALFVFRGRSSDKIKILWWDGQGFCLFYKCLDSGKFAWPKVSDAESLGITGGQLSMLLEGMEWRHPQWSQPPLYTA